MVAFFDRVKVAASGTPGTGVFGVGSAVAGFRTFTAAGVTTGTVVGYVIEDGTAWEVGHGTYSSSGGTLTRTPIATSGGSTSPISASSSAILYITLLAEDIPTGGSGGSSDPLTALLPPSPADFSLESYGRNETTGGVSLVATAVGTQILHTGTGTEGYNGKARLIPVGEQGAFEFIARLVFNGATKSPSSGIYIGLHAGANQAKTMFVGKAYHIGGNDFHCPYGGYTTDGTAGNYTDLDYGHGSEAEWFKFSISGTVASPFVSADGINWTPFASPQDFGATITHHSFGCTKYDSGYHGGTVRYFETTEKPGALIGAGY